MQFRSYKFKACWIFKKTLLFNNNLHKIQVIKLNEAQNLLTFLSLEALLGPSQVSASGRVKEWETFNKIWIIKICSKKRQWWLLNKIKGSEIFLFFF